MKESALTHKNHNFKGYEFSVLGSSSVVSKVKTSL